MLASVVGYNFVCDFCIELCNQFIVAVIAVPYIPFYRISFLFCLDSSQPLFDHCMLCAKCCLVGCLVYGKLCASQSLYRSL